MSRQHLAARRRPLNRRNFLRGAAGVTLALPFLEGLPERSAWAQDQKPVFSFFICGVGGVVASSFFPEAFGPITADGVVGKSTRALSRHASDLLFLSNVVFPPLGSSNDMHVAGLCMALTARTTTGTNTSILATGPSADVVIASKVHPDKAPLTLYSGNKRNGYVTERLSFTTSGQVVPAIDNPYTLYQELIGLTQPGTGMTPEGVETARMLLESRNSVHDLVREELVALIAHPRLSSADRQRLQLHFDSIRDVEVSMGGMGGEAVERCTSQGLDIDKLDALENYMWNKSATEEIGKLHMSLVAMAFACNHRRTATLQWGDAYDRTVYDVPSNDRAWPFSYVSHRDESDGFIDGEDPLAERAHAEIDAVRMESLALGLEHFAARELHDQAFVMWTNHYAEGPSHSARNVPHIIWGNGGGYLKQGEHIDAATGNNRLLNTLISAAIQDTGTTMEDFGEGEGGQLESIRA